MEDGRQIFGRFFLRSLVTVDMSECTKVKEIGDRAFCMEDPGRIVMQVFSCSRLVQRFRRSLDMMFFHNGVRRDYAVLKVPSGCIDAYKAAAGCYFCKYYGIR